MSNKLTLIVPMEETRPAGRVDRGGGEQNSRMGEAVRRLFGAEKNVDLTTAQENLERSIDQVRTLLGRLQLQRIEGWKMDGVSVSLAVSAEGSIGLASAGVEASIEVSFSRVDP